MASPQIIIDQSRTDSNPHLTQAPTWETEITSSAAQLSRGLSYVPLPIPSMPVILVNLDNDDLLQRFVNGIENDVEEADLERTHQHMWYRPELHAYAAYACPDSTYFLTTFDGKKELVQLVHSGELEVEDSFDTPVGETYWSEYLIGRWDGTIHVRDQAQLERVPDYVCSHDNCKATPDINLGGLCQGCFDESQSLKPFQGLPNTEAPITEATTTASAASTTTTAASTSSAPATATASATSEATSSEPTTREAKAIEILPGLIRLDRFEFSYQGSAKKPYLIRLYLKRKATCTCADYTWRKLECKHILAAKLHQSQSLTEFPRTGFPTPAAKTQFEQDVALLWGGAA